MRHTYNTDKFTKEFQEEIRKLWKKDPETEIAVKGPAKKDFEEWIKENYPDAIEDGGYFIIKGEK